MKKAKEVKEFGLFLVTEADVVAVGHHLNEFTPGLHIQFETVLEPNSFDFKLPSEDDSFVDFNYHATVRLPMTVLWDEDNVGFRLCHDAFVLGMWESYVTKYVARCRPDLAKIWSYVIRYCGGLAIDWAVPIQWVHEDGTPYDIKPLERKRLLELIDSR